MGFYEDLERGLLEAISIEKGEIPLIKKENNISQSQLAQLTGNKQQAISRIENKENSPSLKLFYTMANALGYELKMVKITE